MEEKIEKELNNNEEKPTEVQAKQESSAEEANKNIVVIEKPDTTEESYDKVVERERSTLFAAYQKSRKISNLITVFVLLAGVGGVVLITRQNMVCTIIGWALMGATILGMIIFYFVTRNKFPDKTREYIKLIQKKFNENMYADANFTDVTTDPNEKFDVSEVIADGVYDAVAIAQSRNVIHGKYDGKNFLAAEVALFKQQVSRGKKEAPLFVGKYISFPNSLEMKGRIVINIKNPESPLDLPTGVADITALEDKPNLAVYGLKETNVEKVLGKKFYERFLNDFALKDHLVNVNLVVWAGKTAIYCSYDDGAMGLPFDKPFDKTGQNQMVENSLDAFELFNKIGK